LHQKISREIEVIAVNDGSTDRSGEILNEYKKQHDFILFDQENKGLSCARNSGIKTAKGKYLLFMDSDDCFMPDALDQILSYLAKTDAELIEFNYKVLNPAEPKLKLKYKCPAIVSGSGQEVFCAWEKSGFYRPMVWTKAVSRKMIVLNQLYFYPGIYHEDEEWSPKVFAHAGCVCYLPLELYVYRIREGSTMSKKTRKHYMDMLIVIDSLCKFTSSENLSVQYIGSLQRYLSFLYFSLIKGIRISGEYDRQLISALEKRETLIKFSADFHRKYLYRYLINIFGIKIFYMFKYGV
jgi:glycosyltransferase involved in cell wall biosynthesis